MQINPIHLKELAALINAKFIGNEHHLITGLNEIHRVNTGDVVFVDHPKYYNKALNSAASTIIINKEVECPLGKALIIHPEPFTAFNILCEHFLPKNYSLIETSNTAFIGHNLIKMPGCYIGNNVSIGNNVTLHPNVVIYDNCVIGNNVIIHANTTIGSDAFYFKRREKNYEALYTCGEVVIEDDVIIGANCTIDSGVTSTTKIGRASVLDNHIHIGHDVEVGEQCLMAAGVAIAGVCKIGNKVTLWGQVGISSSVIIGDGATVLAKSGVNENIKAGETYFGAPAGPAKEKMREIFAVKQLPNLISKLYTE
ncbi:MAG: UDP-3-O-(3-hydroxymyristoyl)glucosamine N-acyltransferase [Bacteroidetes bacterium]|nr:UDP-3-O-(3-hydroxymyristoyl)glucosamine N-acyltransferase [Bacteroidota bacterium]